MRRVKIRLVLVMVVVYILTPMGQMSEASPSRQTGAPTLVLPHSEYVIDAGWSPDGRWITTQTQVDQTAHLWDATTGVLVASIPHYSENLPAWSPDSTKFVTWQEKRAWIWEVSTGGALEELHYMKPVNNITWRHDSQQIAVLIHDWEDQGGEYHLFDLETGLEAFVLYTNHYSYLSQLSWSPNGHYAFSTGIGSIAFQVWDLANNTEIGELRQAATGFEPTIRNELTTGTWSYESDWVLITNIQGGAMVVDVPNRTTVFRLTDDYFLRRVLWNQSQSFLVGDAAGSRRLPVWNGQTGEFLHYLTSDWLFVDMSWGQDGQSLLTTLWDGNLSSRIVIWDAATGTVIRSVDFGGMYRVSEWSANAEFVAGGWFSFDRIDEPTQIVSVATGEVLLTFARTSIVWHPSENRFLIVVNPYDDCETDCKHEVQVWDVQ